jgi:hypothetical protein
MFERFDEQLIGIDVEGSVGGLILAIDPAFAWYD